MNRTELKRLAEAAIPETQWGYVTEGGELALYWINPWSKQEEKIATFWWPTHPVEATTQVEDWFEQFAELSTQSRQMVLRLLEVLDLAENALSVSRGQWIHSVNATQCLDALAEIEKLTGGEG